MTNDTRVNLAWKYTELGGVRRGDHRWRARGGEGVELRVRSGVGVGEQGEALEGRRGSARARRVNERQSSFDDEFLAKL